MKTFLEWMEGDERKRPDLGTPEGRAEWLRSLSTRLMRGVPLGRVLDALSKYIKKVGDTLMLLDSGLDLGHWAIVADNLSEELDRASKQIEGVASGSDPEGIAQYYQGWGEQELRLLAEKVLGLSAVLFHAAAAAQDHG